MREGKYIQLYKHANKLCTHFIFNLNKPVLIHIHGIINNSSSHLNFHRFLRLECITGKMFLASLRSQSEAGKETSQHGDHATDRAGSPTLVFAQLPGQSGEDTRVSSGEQDREKVRRAVPTWMRVLAPRSLAGWQPRVPGPHRAAAGQKECVCQSHWHTTEAQTPYWTFFRSKE